MAVKFNRLPNSKGFHTGVSDGNIEEGLERAIYSGR
jgi:hypothetical protein